MSAEKKLVEAFSDYIDEAGASNALSIVTGLFVSLVEQCMETKGFDPSKQITVDGGYNRDITIHAQKGIPQ